MFLLTCEGNETLSALVFAQDHGELGDGILLEELVEERRDHGERHLETRGVQRLTEHGTGVIDDHRQVSHLNARPYC